jgi:hypothetical protein
MSTFLKAFFGIAITFTCIFNQVLLAQCSIKKTVRNNTITAETADAYQYLRTDKQYYGLSIKTILVKKAQLKTYTVVIKYTGSVAGVQPASLNFKLKDDYILTANLRFVKLQKVDDAKVNTKIYEIVLPETDLIRLKQTPLKEIQILPNKTLNTVIIAVDDETLIQNQISCLQSMELI